jgi:competence protein ComEC
LNNIKVDRFIDAAILSDTACKTSGNNFACKIVAEYGPGPTDTAPEKLKKYADLLTLVKSKGIEYDPVRSGTFFDAPSDLEIRILSPDRFSLPGEESADNDLSMVAQVVYENGSALFTGDIQREAEEKLTRCYGRLLPSSVLKVPHHGSMTSSTAPFIRAVMPEAAVISTGGPKFYGHPHQKTLAAYEKARIPIFRTDLEGTIVCDVSRRTGEARCKMQYGNKSDL